MVDLLTRYKAEPVQRPVLNIRAYSRWHRAPGYFAAMHADTWALDADGKPVLSAGLGPLCSVHHPRVFDTMRAFINDVARHLPIAGRQARLPLFNLLETQKLDAPALNLTFEHLPACLDHDIAHLVYYYYPRLMQDADHIHAPHRRDCRRLAK